MPWVLSGVVFCSVSGLVLCPVGTGLHVVSCAGYKAVILCCIGLQLASGLSNSLSGYWAVCYCVLLLD